MNPTAGYILDKVVPSLIGTAVGAFIAFRVKRIQDQAEVDKRRKAAATYSLFVLIQGINDLATLEQQYLGEFRNDPAREHAWSAMRMILAFPERLPHRVEDIGWVLDTKHRNVLGEYLAALSGLRTVHGLIEVRNKVKVALDLHAEAELKRLGIKTEGRSFNLAPVLGSITPRMRAELDDSSYGLMEAAAADFHDLYAAMDGLHAAFKEIWPDTQFIKLEPKEELMARLKIAIPDVRAKEEAQGSPRVHRMDAGGIDA